MNTKARIDKRLADWVNAVRKKEGLTPLILHHELTAETDILAIGRRIAHNRHLLSRSAKRLKTSQLKIIGENRVKAPKLVTLAWLLWNSPNHRRLTLDIRAQFFGLKVSKEDHDLFAVMVFASAEGDVAADVISSKMKALR